MDKSSKEEVLNRAYIICKYIINGRHREDLVRMACAQWGVNRKTAIIYHRKATELLSRIREKDLEAQRNFVYASLLNNYKNVISDIERIKADTILSPYKRETLITAKQRLANETLERISKITGLYQERIEITGGIDIGNISDIIILPPPQIEQHATYEIINEV